MAKLEIVEDVEDEEEIEDDEEGGVDDGDGIEEEVEEPEPEAEGKMTQSEFLESIGQADRPGSHMAITSWAEYQAS